ATMDAGRTTPAPSAPRRLHPGADGSGRDTMHAQQTGLCAVSVAGRLHRPPRRPHRRAAHRQARQGTTAAPRARAGAAGRATTPAAATTSTGRYLGVAMDAAASR